MSQKQFGTLLFNIDLSTISNPELPPKAEDGRIPVYNGDGYASPVPHPLSQEFVSFSSTVQSPVLDIGAAYGLTSINALKKGATVICNEKDIQEVKDKIENLAKDFLEK